MSKGVESWLQYYLSRNKPWFHKPEACYLPQNIFSGKTRVELARRGYKIYTLKRESIITLAGKFAIWSKWHQQYPEIEFLRAHGSEVAILPHGILPESNNQTAPQQLQILYRFWQQLGGIEGAQIVVIGSAPDYLELAFQHLIQNQERLFPDFYVTTSTQVENTSLFATVGRFNRYSGIGVSNRKPNEPRTDVYLAPLIIPTVQKNY